MKNPIFLFAAFILSTISLTSFLKNTPKGEVTIAAFKNNAEGAYTLIHDDFGADWAKGIELYADTMAFSRGIPFSFATITGKCDSSDWTKARQMIAHGHQIINHSMTHKCGQPVEWCKTEYWNEKDFAVEIDQSTEYILKHTGKHPAFFIFPFDLFTDTMLTYLEQKKYAGARAGRQNITQNTVISNPFRLNFKVFRPENSFDDLNAFADEAVKKKGWAIRVIHGVNDESWAKIPLKEYANHLDYLKSLSEKKDLWVANMSDIVAYTYLREKFSPSIKYDTKGRIESIDFISIDNNNSDSYNQALNTASSKILTLIINQDFKTKYILQKNKKLTLQLKDNDLLVDVDPQAGRIHFSY